MAVAREQRAAAKGYRRVKFSLLFQRLTRAIKFVFWLLPVGNTWAPIRAVPLKAESVCAGVACDFASKLGPDAVILRQAAEPLSQLIGA